MEYKKLKQRIINHYGENHQMAKTVEELTELIHTLSPEDCRAENGIKFRFMKNWLMYMQCWTS